jgi:hypothetical protein
MPLDNDQTYRQVYLGGFFRRLCAPFRGAHTKRRLVIAHLSLSTNSWRDNRVLRLCNDGEIKVGRDDQQMDVTGLPVDARADDFATPYSVRLQSP